MDGSAFDKVAQVSFMPVSGYCDTNPALTLPVTFQDARLNAFVKIVSFLLLFSFVWSIKGCNQNPTQMRHPFPLAAPHRWQRQVFIVLRDSRHAAGYHIVAALGGVVRLVPPIRVGKAWTVVARCVVHEIVREARGHGAMNRGLGCTPGGYAARCGRGGHIVDPERHSFVAVRGRRGLILRLTARNAAMCGHGFGSIHTRRRAADRVYRNTRPDELLGSSRRVPA